MNRTRYALAALVTAALLAGCTGTADDNSPRGPNGPYGDMPDPAPGVETTEPAAPPASWGSTQDVAEGVAVTVGEPSEITLEEGLSVDAGQRVVGWPVKLANSSPYPVGDALSVEAVSPEGDVWWTYGGLLEDNVLGAVQPGRTGTYTAAFAVPQDAREAVVTITVDGLTVVDWTGPLP